MQASHLTELQFTHWKATVLRVLASLLFAIALAMSAFPPLSEREAFDMLSPIFDVRWPIALMFSSRGIAFYARSIRLFEAIYEVVIFAAFVMYLERSMRFNFALLGP